MKPEMLDALNKQINAEIYSSYLYFAMAAYCDDNRLPGFANWMRCQAQEELFHAAKFYKYINERGGRVTMSPIDGPPNDWKDPLEVFKNVLSHEQHVTELISNLVDLSLQLKDFTAHQMLDWFVGEQVEEEDTARGIIDSLELVKGDGRGMLMLDRELAQRTFVAPPLYGAGA